MTAALLEPPPVTAPDERLVTRAEAAKILRVSERTVDRLATDGKITRRIVGTRLVRFLESDVRAAAQERDQ